VFAREGDSLFCLAVSYATEYDCFGISYILPNQVFRKYITFIVDKMSSPAGIDPRAVV